MILIADSGSTKCSWALCNQPRNVLLTCETIGFNPHFIDQKNILKHLQNSILVKYQDEIETVFFYGAGCSSHDKNMIIEESLNIFFKNAKINIRHDIDGACFAVYNGNPNITCILGTGSNACYFDGEKIIENAPALGFLIGDEASGNSFGKKMLNLYFNKRLPNNLKQKFEKNYETNLSIVKANIYGNNRANAYLAKYFPFVCENKENTILKDVIYESLHKFFDLHICCYKNYTEVEINFIGSVAYYLSKEITLVAQEYNCKIGNIIRHPINKLVEYHSNKIIKDNS